MSGLDHHPHGLPASRWPRWLLACWLPCWLGCAAPAAVPRDESAPPRSPVASPRSPPPDSDGPALAIAEVVAGRLPEFSGAVRHPLWLTRGEAVRLEVDQQDFDLEVEILDPQGVRLLTFDGPYGKGAPERLCFVAPNTGLFALRVAPFRAGRGRYRIRLLSRGPATAADRKCAAAAQRFMAAQSALTADGPSELLAVEYQQIHQLWAGAGESFLAAVAQRQAGIVWRALGRGTEAELRFQETLKRARQAGSGYLEIHALFDLGQMAIDRGSWSIARDVLQAAVERAKQAGDGPTQALALSRLARVEARLGDLHQAIGRFRQALAIRGNLSHDLDSARIQIDLADAYTQLDRYREAYDLMLEAVPIVRAAGDGQREAAALVSLGWLLHLMGRSAEGALPLRRAGELYGQAGNRLEQAAATDRLGSALRAAGDREGAAAAYHSSLALAEQLGNGWYRGNFEINLGCLEQETGHPREALGRLARARAAIGGIADPKTLAYLSYCQAAAEFRLDQLDLAVEHLRAARRIVADLRGRARELGQRYGPVWLWQDFEELYFEVSMAKARRTGEPGYEAAAFAQIDFARAQSFFELVIESRIGVRAAASPELLRREKKLRLQLNALAARRLEINGAGAPQAPLRELERELDSVAADLEWTEAEIRRADPLFARLVDPVAGGAAAVQELLEPGTLMLRYVLAAEQGFLFTLGPRHWRVFHLGGRRQLDPQIETVYRGLRECRRPDRQVDLAAEALARELLPAGAIPAGTRRLVIVADSLLHYLPFAALPAGDGKGEKRLLVDDYEIHYLPAAGMLKVFAQPFPTSPPRSSAAVFADAVFADDDPRLTGQPEELCAAGERSLSVERLPRDPLPRLPCTRDEALRLLRSIGAGSRLAALGFEARKQTLLASDLSRYGILHLATHAFIDEQYPDLSGLVLSQRDRAGRPVDGRLFVHEIYGLKLRADLVTLSGCQTALGRQVRGDGLLGMTRGFFYAGAARVLVSLWAVDDEATSELMGAFYQALLERGEAPAQALRSAQRHLRDTNRWRSPYYWAPWVLVGSA